jgi:hypothetical protein
MSRRLLTALAALSLVAACRTASTTTTTISGTPRLEPVPAGMQPAPAAAPAGAFDPAGRWSLVFDVGGQGLAVELQLVKTPDGGYGGSMTSQMGETPITKAMLTGTKLEASFTAPDGGGGTMTLNFDGTKVTGTWSASGMSSTLSGARP